jgi:hypothetical protein
MVLAHHRAPAITQAEVAERATAIAAAAAADDPMGDAR